MRLIRIATSASVWLMAMCPTGLEPDLGSQGLFQFRGDVEFAEDGIGAGVEFDAVEQWS
jgi:hypothetical protein